MTEREENRRKVSVMTDEELVTYIETCKNKPEYKIVIALGADNRVQLGAIECLAYRGEFESLRNEIIKLLDSGYDWRSIYQMARFIGPEYDRRCEETYGDIIRKWEES